MFVAKWHAKYVRGSRHGDALNNNNQKMSLLIVLPNVLIAKSHAREQEYQPLNNNNKKNHCKTPLTGQIGK